jgi:hypothetical protein
MGEPPEQRCPPFINQQHHTANAGNQASKQTPLPIHTHTHTHTHTHSLGSPSFVSPPFPSPGKPSQRAIPTPNRQRALANGRQSPNKVPCSLARIPASHNTTRLALCRRHVTNRRQTKHWTAGYVRRERGGAECRMQNTANSKQKGKKEKRKKAQCGWEAGVVPV